MNSAVHKFADGRSTKRPWILSVVFGIFAASLFAGKFLSTYFDFVNNAPRYAIHGLFVSYSACGKYMRRELIGELLWQLNRFGVKPQYVIYPLCIVSCIAVVFIFLRTTRRKGYNWWAIFLSFSLGGMYLPKADFFFFLIVMAIVHAFAHIKRQWLRMLVVNLLGIVAINTHEVSFFLTVPLMAVVLLGECRAICTFGRFVRLLSMTPMVLAFLLAALFNGERDIGAVMANGWAGVLRDGFWSKDAIATGIDVYFGGSAAFYARTTVENLFCESTYGVMNVFWLTAFALGILVAFAKAPTLYAENRESSTLPTLLVFQALCLLPVFPFFIDYTRFFAIWTMSAYWWFLEIDNEKLKVAFPVMVGFGTFERTRNRVLVIALLCVLGMSPYHLDVKHCFSRSIAGVSWRIGRVAYNCAVIPRQNGTSLMSWFRDCCLSQ